MDRTIPMKDTSLYHKSDYTMLMEELEDAELFADDLSFANPYKSKVILDQAYQETDPSTVAQQQSHMSPAEKQCNDFARQQNRESSNNSTARSASSWLDYRGYCSSAIAYTMSTLVTTLEVH